MIRTSARNKRVRGKSRQIEYRIGLIVTDCLAAEWRHVKRFVRLFARSRCFAFYRDKQGATFCSIRPIPADGVFLGSIGLADELQ
jgi:hypothetical protein